jgi:hypothetical protein
LIPMPKNKRIEPPGSDEYFRAYEVLMRFSEEALINDELAAKKLGITRDDLPALEKAKILMPAGKHRKSGDRRLYSLRTVIVLRNDPEALDQVVDALVAASAEKTPRQRPRKAKRPLSGGERRLGRQDGSAD